MDSKLYSVKDFKAQCVTTWTSPLLTVGDGGAHGGKAAGRRNTQDITAASQIRGSFSRDNSPQKKQGKLVGRCTAHARERQTSNRKNIPFDQRFLSPT
jgi:hypothetical protein